MTDVLDVHGDILRRALHIEADASVPSPDGLERIRHRMYHPSVRDRTQRLVALIFSAPPSKGDRNV